MSDAYTEGGNAAALGAADWLCLAATPTFAIMALLTGVLGGGAPDTACMTAQDASPLGGMVPMYVLMSVFHSGPWLKLMFRRRGGAAGPDPVASPPRSIGDDHARQQSSLARGLAEGAP